MIPEQQELPLFRAEKADENVRQFVALLLEDGRWLMAADVLHRLQMPYTETNRRHARAWAEAAADEVISGQKGYRHVLKATPEEIRHFCDWMESQGKKMIQRAIRTRRHAHGLVG